MSTKWQDIVARSRLFHRAWRYRLRTEKAEVAFMLRHLSQGQTAIDIGSHKGAFAYWMSRRVGAQGRVLAFEPIPFLADYLRRMKRIGPLRGVEVVETALSDHRGNADLFTPEHGHLGTTTLLPQQEGHKTVQVQVDTLDSYCKRNKILRVDFIKCDVEGHELEVFRGAERILRENHPTLLFECQDSRHEQGQIDRVFPFLQGLGYRGCFFPGGKPRPLHEFRADIHQVLWTDPFWCDNFGFVFAHRVPTSHAA